MTDLSIANMPLPLHKPISEYDELDHLILAARAAEIAAVLQPACFRERQYRTTYVRPDGKLFVEPLFENSYN